MNFFSLKCAVILWVLGTGLRSHAMEPLQFNRDIRAILSDHCFSCHGPDSAHQEAGLRLDQRDAALALLDSGARAIVPGSSEDSLLLARVFSDDEDLVMPPPSSNKKLSAAQKSKLRQWIEEGAEYESHWAFQRIETPMVPREADLAAEAPDWMDWPQNQIDWFVLKEMLKAGLRPSPRAEPSALARRIALDLTGLPPIPERLREFKADRLDKYIDAMFASPRYGERMAVEWLDAARFADTQGYQVDRDQDMHPFRDWVISAFNQNMPFDQFTVEQLAGDLLPDATIEQQVATGFHRNHMVNQEGGIIPAEFIAEYTADRVETTAAVWMGQTFTCARCHDHKFDPFTQKEFYALKAFFNNVGEQGDGAQDTIALPSATLDEQIATLQSELDSLQVQLSRREISEEEVQSWANRLVEQRLEWLPLEFLSVSAEQGSPALSNDHWTLHLGPVNRETSPIKVQLRLPVGRQISALRLECSTGAEDTSVTVSEISAQHDEQPVVLWAAVEGQSLKATQVSKLFSAKERKKNVVLKPKPIESAESIVLRLDVPVAIRTDNDLLVLSWMVTSADQDTGWRAYFTEAAQDQLVDQATWDIAKQAPSERTPASRNTLKAAYQASLAETRNLKSSIEELQERIAEFRDQRPTAIVMDEREKPKDTFILMRGAYDKPGEKVTASTPAVLPAMSDDQPRNRLGLARWLVHREHPLTARVTVNRLWQQVFGIGLVRTSEDFGSQGEAPSHPELLDWLACEFMSSGWDVQHILHLILESATYQQSSRLTPALLAADPENRLLARGARFRLNAEFVRDQALAAAGLLSGRMGGASVKPYHPAGLYELVTPNNPTTTRVYIEDKGEDLYRRSLYTYWKRSVPHPAMIAFDAPGREVCTLRRPRSNTALQALNLMNDATFVEAARHLAAKMLNASSGITEQIQYGYRRLLARDATPAELDVLIRAFARNRADFERQPGAAAGLLTSGASDTVPGEADPAALAAMTGVASTMMCLDETITRE